MDKASERSTCVVHLVWAPLGVSMVEGFVSAYERHSAGLEHELAIVLNGFNGPQDPRLQEVRLALSGVEHECLAMAQPVLDLEAYRRAAQQLPAAALCFMNSYSRPLADGWLAKLAAGLDEPDVGLVGPSGSWGSIRTYNRFMLGLGGYYARVFPDRRAAIATLAEVAARHDPSPRNQRRAPMRFARELLERSHGFRGFPAPHIRTSAFMVEAETFRSLGIPELVRKPDALRLESGRNGITAQFERLGSRSSVIGRDGRAYSSEEWPASGTFWQGDQENLLIADKQTADYELADGPTRATLSRYAWGESADPSGAPSRPPVRGAQD